MRIRLVVVALHLAVLPAVAADLRPPENLPRYDFAIQLDVAGHQAHVTQNVVWFNKTAKPVEQLVFNVHSHFTPPKTAKEIDQFARMLEIFRIPYREAIYKENAFTLHKVERLRKVGNEWQRDELKAQWNKDLTTALIVPLPEPVPPGGSVAVSLSYTMELPQKQGRWGQWKGVTTLSNWHPILAFHDAEKGWQPTPFVPWHQPWFNEAGVYTALVRLPTEEQVACTGSISKVEMTGEKKNVSIGPVTARDFSLITSSRFQETFTEAVNAGGAKVKVKCMAFAEHEFYAKVLVKYAARAIEAYSKWFGPYPYPEFTVAESYFGWNGNELCGMVMIDERVFGMPHLAEHYVEYLISHETCHQWFYNAIGTDGYRETFMDEAIVVYLSHRLLDEIEGKNNELLNYPPWLAWLPGIRRENYRYAQFYATLRDGDLKPAVGELQTYGNVVNLFSAVYDRGSKIVGMIQARLGPTAFLEFLRHIYSKYYFRIIRVADLKRELEEYTGRNWDDFFKEWMTTNGMSDWAVDGVKVTPGPGGYTASVKLSQRAEINEETVLGFSFDGGKSYPIRVPVNVPKKSGIKAGNVGDGLSGPAFPAGFDRHPEKLGFERQALPGEFASDVQRSSALAAPTLTSPLGDGIRSPSSLFAAPGAGPIQPAGFPFNPNAPESNCEPLDDSHFRIDVTLPEMPNQIAVDPDLVIPDTDPANNFWHLPIHFRPRPLYTFLDEEAFTNDYDKWNVIFGPWAYADPNFESWYTRMSVLGARIGVDRLEEFRGGVYVGYRPTFGDIAVGADGIISHFPWPKSELGFNVEKSVAAFLNESDEYRPDRGVVWLRNELQPTASLYSLPREFIDQYVAYQDHWLPDPRVKEGEKVDSLTTVGVRYYRESYVPYWDPEMGFRLDGNLALGLPLFGQDQLAGLAWGQASWVTTPPEGLGWLSDVKLALRAFGGIGFPNNSRLFTLGGNQLFRGFDEAERQGSAMWVGSVELRVPVYPHVDWDVLDRMIRLENVYLAPFYDVGDIYVNHHATGPVANAVGVGLRLDVSFFRFLERATIRFDAAQAIDSDAGTQFWFGLQHAF